MAKHQLMKLKNKNKLVPTDRPEINPCCKGEIILLKTLAKINSIQCSNSLGIADKILIGL